MKGESNRTTTKKVMILLYVINMPKILICDDESGVRAVIKRYAEFEGFEVSEASNGMEAVNFCKKEQFDIIIMDIMMPELDGFSAVKEIRKTTNIPVIMLSARGEEYDKILGFEVGVDDYVVKPFSSKEIMLRVNAILRRSNKYISAETDENGHIVFEKEGLKADMTAYRVIIDGIQAEMAPKEYDLLFYLVRNKNIAVPREKIITEVWGYDYFGDDRTLDTHMKLLRKSLGPYAKFITTLRGLGYRFDG
jgi:two-component system response regulator ResD